MELWLDVTCPWCYLGRHRLEKAVEASASDGEVTVVLRSFELDPGMSTPMPLTDYLGAKFAGTVARAREADARVAALVRGEGLPYTTDRQVANTRDVHRVLHLARAHGAANQLFWSLQRGYFGGELSPFEPATLVRVAEDVGVPADETRTMLSGDGYADAVRRELATGRALGITGVPFAVLAGVYGVAGAQSVETYAAAIRTAIGGA